jgi:molybdopterin-containing oxidoreductase family membrane subunit
MEHFEYLFFGLDGKQTLVPWMWTSQLFAFAALVVLLVPKWRKNEKILLVTCFAVIISIWIEKGLGMVITGFIPSPLGGVTEYWPTPPEVLISLGIYAFGALVLTVLYKIATSVREEIELG